MLSETQKINPGTDYINHIGEKDTWRVKVRDKETNQLYEVGKPIITHAAVERLAHVYGVTVKRYVWLKTELHDTMVMIEVEGFWDDGRVTPEVGECNKASAGEVGSKYPHSMAWKRGYDRAVLAHLGIDAYSAEEAEDFAKGERVYGSSNNNSRPTQTSSSGAKNAPAAQPTQEQNTSSKKAEESQKSAISKSINILQIRGKDITLESFLAENFGGKSLDNFSFDEAAKALALVNDLIASS